MASELAEYKGLYGTSKNKYDDRRMDEVVNSTLKAASALEKAITEPVTTEGRQTFSERLCGCTKDC